MSVSMPAPMPILFIADLHLSDHTPSLNALFAQFLRDWQGNTAALYILGDLFDAWTGDDDDSATAAQVAQQLAAFAADAPVYFIAGNRDFLLGKRYAAQCRMTLLPENQIVEYFGKTILLTHGDEMCTDDVGYLRYRKIMRNKIVQKILLSLPFRTRKNIAAKLRAASCERKKQPENYAVADVTEQGVQAALARHPHAQIIIHGHTHRPACHVHTFNQREIARYVLQDWYDGKGGYLLLDERGVHAHGLPE